MAGHTDANELAGNDTSTPMRTLERLRLWPAGLIIALYWAIRIGSRTRLLRDFLGPLTAHAGLVSAVGLLVWWLFFSRLRVLDRFLGLVVLVIGGAAAILLTHDTVKSLSEHGFVIFAAPFVLTPAFAWLLAARRASPRVQIAGFAVVVLAAWSSFMLVRVGGVGGDLSVELKWRWSHTAEQEFLKERGTVAAMARSTPIGPLVVSPADWPEFRGPDRDNRVAGVRIETDWVKYPPKLAWKRRIGPGWSSFAVVGNFFFTQEQRSDDEATVCCRVDTGAEVWSRLDAARFWDVSTGAGPRATPTFHDNRVYTLGATGLFNCLDAATGRLLWQRDVTKDVGVKRPEKGFAASPLVVGDKVIVFAGGRKRQGNRCLPHRRG